ncbi:MAG: hypothetical protein JW841_02895 [Deltaproteobacteria bacterium]|nr:hypothetical protein [Deltaproteobacteria bacterium]
MAELNDSYLGYLVISDLNIYRSNNVNILFDDNLPDSLTIGGKTLPAEQALLIAFDNFVDLLTQNNLLAQNPNDVFNFKYIFLPQLYDSIDPELAELAKEIFLKFKESPIVYGRDFLKQAPKTVAEALFLCLCTKVVSNNSENPSFTLQVGLDRIDALKALGIFKPNVTNQMIKQALLKPSQTTPENIMSSADVDYLKKDSHMQNAIAAITPAKNFNNGYYNNYIMSKDILSGNGSSTTAQLLSKLTFYNKTNKPEGTIATQEFNLDKIAKLTAYSTPNGDHIIKMIDANGIHFNISTSVFLVELTTPQYLITNPTAKRWNPFDNFLTISDHLSDSYLYSLIGALINYNSKHKKVTSNNPAFNVVLNSLINEYKKRHVATKTDIHWENSSDYYKHLNQKLNSIKLDNWSKAEQSAIVFNQQKGADNLQSQQDITNTYSITLTNQLTKADLQLDFQYNIKNAEISNEIIKFNFLNSNTQNDDSSTANSGDNIKLLALLFTAFYNTQSFQDPMAEYAILNGMDILLKSILNPNDIQLSVDAIVYNKSASLNLIEIPLAANALITINFPNQTNFPTSEIALSFNFEDRSYALEVDAKRFNIIKNALSKYINDPECGPAVNALLNSE